MKVPFIYLGYKPDTTPKYYGDQIFLESLIKDEIEVIENLADFQGEGIVISVRAWENISFIDQLNADIARFKWVLIVVTNNENSNDFFKLIKHPNCKIWLQTPKDSDKADFYLPFGYPTKMHLYNSQEERSFDWFFAGQVTHSRRRGAVEAIKSLQNKSGFLLETAGFNQGLEYPDYAKILKQSKIVFCPGGMATPDTFRVFEALECGCIPIIDAQSGRGYSTLIGGYWDKVLGEDYPMLVIRDWSDLELYVEEILANYAEYKEEIDLWWMRYKKSIPAHFLNDAKKLKENI